MSTYAKRIAWLAILPVLMLSCENPAQLNAPETPGVASPSFDQSNAPDKTMWRVHGDGALMEFSRWTGEPYQEGSYQEYCDIYVNRGGNGQDRETHLWYYCFSRTYDVAWHWVEEGEGTIPNDDFNGSAASQLTLNTDTSADANPDYIRSWGDGGLLSLTWQKTDEWKYTSHGGGMWTYETPCYKEMGRGGGGFGTEYSAAAQGSAFEFDDIEVPGSDGFENAETRHVRDMSIWIVHDNCIPVPETDPPIIGFGGITGLNASNAATTEFVLDATVVDRNGDGTAVASAMVQVTVTIGGGGSCDTPDAVTEADVQVTPEGGNDDPSGFTVIADVTADVQSNNGDFSKLFTAANQSANLGIGSYTYCFTIFAEDDFGNSSSAAASKDFMWQ